jgi:hypothetical protein
MRLAIAATALLLSLALAPDARACGGCFVAATPAPTGDAATSQSGTVVTDHRMVLAITDQGTTLWDQIQYVGDPAAFAWVLPIQGDVVVSVGSDAFIQSLDEATAPQIHAPIVYCQSPQGSSMGGSSGPSCACGSSADDAATAVTLGGKSSDGGEEDSGVVVTHREVVGPYETVQLRGDGSESIVAWLDKNGFEVPTSIAPVVQKYVDEKFGFLAVRLQPGVGVRAMKPLRVSWPGKMPSLPLRMVAAGVATSVGLKLFVVGDGRWRPQNFPAFIISANDISWDFAASRSTYTDVRASIAKSFDGRAWGIESSIDLRASDVRFTSESLPGDAGVSDAGGLPPPGDNDVQVAFHDAASRRVTRLRADLPVRHLGVDLQLEADPDQTAIPVDLRPVKSINADKLCPTGIAYSQPGNLLPLADTRGSCAVVVRSASPELRNTLGAFGALAVFGLLRRFTCRKRATDTR